MAPTKSEFLGYKPNDLVGHAQDVQTLFNELNSHGESLADAHGQVQKQFEGKAADAYHADTTSNLADLARLQGAGADLNKALGDAGESVTKAWESVRDYVNDVTQKGFDIGEDWSVKPSGGKEAKSMQDVSVLQDVAKQIQEKIKGWDDAENSAADAIHKAIDKLAGDKKPEDKKPEDKKEEDKKDGDKKEDDKKKDDDNKTKDKAETKAKEEAKLGEDGMPGRAREKSRDRTYEKTDDGLKKVGDTDWEKKDTDDEKKNRKPGDPVDPKEAKSPEFKAKYKVDSPKAHAEYKEGKDKQETNVGGVHMQAKEEGKVLAAEAGANLEVTKDSIKAGVSAEADLVKGSVSAEASAGPVVGKVGASGAIDAHADASISVGKDGVKVEASAFAGAEANASASVGVKGATVDGTVGVTAGIGASGDVTFGKGEDGKYHFGLHGKFAFGIGANVSLGATIDPEEVTKTVGEVAHDVSNAYHETTQAVSSAVDTVGKALESINPFDW